VRGNFFAQSRSREPCEDDDHERESAEADCFGLHEGRDAEHRVAGRRAGAGCEGVGAVHRLAHTGVRDLVDRRDRRCVEVAGARSLARRDALVGRGVEQLAVGALLARNVRGEVALDRRGPTAVELVRERKLLERGEVADVTAVDAVLHAIAAVACRQRAHFGRRGQAAFRRIEPHLPRVDARAGDPDRAVREVRAVARRVAQQRETLRRGAFGQPVGLDEGLQVGDPGGRDPLAVVAGAVDHRQVAGDEFCLGFVDPGCRCEKSDEKRETVHGVSFGCLAFWARVD